MGYFECKVCRSRHISKAITGQKAISLTFCNGWRVNHTMSAVEKSAKNSIRRTLFHVCHSEPANVRKTPLNGDSTELFIGVDVGTKAIRATILDEGGNMVEHSSLPIHHLVEGP